MRKYLALALVIVFLTPIHSVAAVKAGDKCAKLKATSTSAGKKYTCIKSGSRLIWDKGQVIKAPATPAKPAAATPEPSPSAAPVQQVDLPKEGSLCPKVGDKVMNGLSGMRCTWAGHATSEEAALLNMQWRRGRGGWWAHPK